MLRKKIEISDAHTCPQYQFKSLQRIDDNVWLVVASLKKGKSLAVKNRNMLVLRHNKKELSLVNPVRLDDESELLKLGKYRRLIRLAPNVSNMEHDRFYLNKSSSITRWAPAPAGAEFNYPNNLPVHRVLTQDDDSILPSCHVFCFQCTKQPECALVILQDYVGNLLVTGEALQAHRDNPLLNLSARAQMAAKGLMTRDIIVPPSWIKLMQKGSTQTGLRDDLESLLRLDFERMVSSTGVMVHQKAKEKAVIAVEHSLPVW